MRRRLNFRPVAADTVAMVHRCLLLALALAATAALADPPHARKGAPPEPEDPLEQLGRRLADKLGARPDGNGDGFVLRVPARAAPAARPAAATRCERDVLHVVGAGAALAPGRSLEAGGRRYRLLRLQFVDTPEGEPSVVLVLADRGEAQRCAR